PPPRRAGGPPAAGGLRSPTRAGCRRRARTGPRPAPPPAPRACTRARLRGCASRVFAPFARPRARRPEGGRALDAELRIRLVRGAAAGAGEGRDARAALLAPLGVRLVARPALRALAARLGLLLAGVLRRLARLFAGAREELLGALEVGQEILVELAQHLRGAEAVRPVEPLEVGVRELSDLALEGDVLDGAEEGVLLVDERRALRQGHPQGLDRGPATTEHAAEALVHRDQGEDERHRGHRHEVAGRRDD